MRVVGVDLAWSSGGTGLCAVEDGRAVASTRVTSDDEIVQWVEPFLHGDCLLAVDAPVVVANETGRRRCEQDVSRAFGGYHAGAHSSNLSLAAFTGGARARRLADRLGLDYDPFSPDCRLIEVYPHPALVALFGLPRALKYKAKRGRTPEFRHEEFRRLVRFLESLRHADPPLDVTTSERWGDLTERATTSTVHAELDRVEDELDAFVCAYIGLFFLEHGQARCWVAGDLESGYIVVPLGGAQPASPLHAVSRALEGVFAV